MVNKHYITLCKILNCWCLVNSKYIVQYIIYFYLYIYIYYHRGTMRHHSNPRLLGLVPAELRRRPGHRLRPGGRAAGEGHHCGAVQPADLRAGQGMVLPRRGARWCPKSLATLGAKNSNFTGVYGAYSFWLRGG